MATFGPVWMGLPGQMIEAPEKKRTRSSADLSSLEKKKDSARLNAGWRVVLECLTTHEKIKFAMSF